jgi:hypothetical protein
VQDEVLLKTEIEAIPSCSKSVAALFGANFSSVPMLNGAVLLNTKTPRLRATVRVFDADGLRISRFAPRIVLVWDKPLDETASQQRELVLARDVSLSNEFHADIPADERNSPGMYNLTLTIYKGWNGSGEVDCEIMRLSIMVVCEAGFVLEGSVCVGSSNSQLVLGLALGAIFVATVAALAFILIWSWRRDPERAKRMLRWIIQSELRLVAEGLVELWDAASDNLTFFLVVRPSNSSLVAPYTCMICITNFLSLGVIALKLRRLVSKCIGRTKEPSRRSSILVDGLAAAVGCSVSQRVLDTAEKIDRQREALQEQQDAHVIEKEGIYSELALGLFEDIPFIVLNMSVPLIVSPWPCGFVGRHQLCMLQRRLFLNESIQKCAFRKASEYELPCEEYFGSMRGFVIIVISLLTSAALGSCASWQSLNTVVLSQLLGPLPSRSMVQNIIIGTKYSTGCVQQTTIGSSVS